MSCHAAFGLFLLLGIQPAAPLEFFPSEPYQRLQLAYTTHGLLIQNASDQRDRDDGRGMGHNSRTWDGVVTGQEVTIEGMFTAPEGTNAVLLLDSSLDRRQATSRRLEVPGGTTSPFKLTVSIPAETMWVYVSVVATHTLGPWLQLQGTFTVPRAQPQGCDEARRFYPPAVLEGYYTGTGSLRFTREALVQQMLDALDRYQTEGGKAEAGVGAVDSAFIAASLATGAMPSGREQSLHEAAQQYGRSQGGLRLKPGDLFYLALKQCGGNVQQALLTCHAALYRKRPENGRFIDTWCEQLRNPEGYSATHRIIANGKPSTPRLASGSDEQGVWYHFFGMAALEFSDQNGLAPFQLVRQAAEEFDKTGAAATLKRDGFPVGQIGGQLSNYAVALENAIRNNMASAPDPDKQCINYSGIAAGKALVDRLSHWRPPAPTPSPATGGDVLAPSGVAYFRSPLSFTVRGKHGEEISFDQREKRFTTNTPAAIVEPFAEKDGTWGMLFTPLFEVTQLEYVATRNAPVTVAFYSYGTKRATTHQIDVREGQLYEVTDWAQQQVWQAAPGAPPQPAAAAAPVAGRRAATDEAGAPGPANAPVVAPLRENFLICRLPGEDGPIEMGTFFSGVSELYAYLRTTPLTADAVVDCVWVYEGRTYARSQLDTKGKRLVFFRVRAPNGEKLPVGDWTVILSIQGKEVDRRPLVVEPQ